MARGKRVPVDQGQASSYMAKADQFLRAAQQAAADSEYDAVMLNAIHAAISGSDAVSVAIAGVRSTDPDHQRGADLLLEVAGASSEVRDQVRQLRRLLASRNAVEYESRRARAAESADALKRASRLVTWASEVVRG